MTDYIDDGGIYEAAKSLHKIIYYKMQDHPSFREDIEEAIRDAYMQGYNDAKEELS